MSYNIDHVKTLTLKAAMKVCDVRTLREKHKKDLPELCFLTEIELPTKTANADDPTLRAALQELAKHDSARAEALAQKARETEMVELRSFRWCSTGSGHAYDLLRYTVAPLIKGEVEVVLTWEGGEMSGFRIKDGRFEEMDVEYKLVPKKGR